MDAGVVAEIGPPRALLADPSSAFSKLVDATGVSGAAALRKMAADFEEERARGQVGPPRQPGAPLGRGGVLAAIWLGTTAAACLPALQRPCLHAMSAADPLPSSLPPLLLPTVTVQAIGFKPRPSLEQARASLDLQGRPMALQMPPAATTDTSGSTLFTS